MQVSYRYGGRNGRPYSLATNEDLIVVRTHDGVPLASASLSGGARKLLESFERHAGFPRAGVEVWRTRGAADTALRDRARDVLTRERAVRFAGRVLCDPSLGGQPARAKDPVLYTENFFVKLADELKASAAKKLLSSYGLKLKRDLGYLRNGYFVGVPEGHGMEKVFGLAEALLRQTGVELCHPELVRRRERKAAFPQQWHLKSTRIGRAGIKAHANVAAAWRLAQGRGVTIAIVDDGVDVDHEEFAGKVVHPRDVTDDLDDGRPGDGDNHGTACAGVACAAGRKGASGVAPKARLMPIRLMSDLGSQDEADAFAWAADHGADVISCSWGPADGRWWLASDPLHDQFAPLPDSTRLGIDYAATQGRGGKGCVILFAAGNGNESVDNDGYASYEKVIAVAACNDTSRRSVYSDFGRAVWCAFPSNDFGDDAGHPAPLTPGIWTTDRHGRPGYNPGASAATADDAGNYTNSFGGTSSACPGAAGVAALVLSKNRNLRRDEVKEIFKDCCQAIDTADGRYDANGRSPLYGYGRLDALKAVKLAAARLPAGQRKSARRQR